MAAVSGDPCAPQHLCRLFTDVTVTEHPVQDAEQENAASGTYNYLLPKDKNTACSFAISHFLTFF